ncbi:TonB-dependent receptor [Aurantiacibacter aquimixticola]|uniref:TonB-dependent receptor n=1 Tax=Aurantiacibacter aquimixticola TaxID=1958945 RepID=A0A419RW84_9SPHN|nr:TonB-dependent receptor [Aurantiacibacter aquimixticola]RJY10041.1 TonB-dependent receptor [Aurantiacibacter aquimixticola]
MTKARLLNTAAKPLARALAASALLVSGTALAQEADQSATDEVVQDPQAEDGAIIVTAQRRAQNLQDVPAAVTALSAEMLENRQIADTNDLQNQIPNVVISTGTGTANSARIFFRGIGEDESRGAIDPAVGIYIDNVYLGRTVGSLIDLVDVEQIEVLRGPQGTLYGRNTNGGAIKISSVRPQLLENSLAGEFSYGNYDRWSARASANVALGDESAVRLSFLQRERDGYFTLNPNGDFASQAGTRVGDEQVTALRGSIFTELTDNWSFLGIVDYTDDNSEPVPSSIITQSDDPDVVTDRDGDLFTIEPAPGTTCSSFVPAGFQPLGCFTDFESDVQNFGLSGQITGEFDNFTVSSITAYRTLNDNLSTHITFPYFQETDQDQFSQELLLNTNFDGAFNVVTGVYYYTEDAFIDFDFVFPFDVLTETESFAVFGQANVELGALTLTGGLRWTTEDRTVTGNAGGPLAGFGTGIVREFDTDNVTYTGKVDYSFTDDVLVYASYSTGFKTPGASPDCFSPAACFAPVDEESLDAFEVGLRSQFFDGMATFNATYFYNDYQDLQISGTLPNGAFTRINAGAAQIQGVELETSFNPLDGLTIYANGSWLDAEYDDLNFNQAGLLTNSTNTAPGAICTNATATPGSSEYEGQIVDCALGLDLKNAPEWKGLLGFNYEILTGPGEVFFGADLAYESDSFALVANPPGSLVEPGFRVDARIGFEADNERWRVTLWGKNLTDREYFRASTNTNGLGNQAYPAPPLTFGVDVGFRFD